MERYARPNLLSSKETDELKLPAQAAHRGPRRLNFNGFDYQDCLFVDPQNNDGLE